MHSLASRIAIVTVALVSLAVAIAIGTTWLMSQRIAEEAVSDSLAASQAMQRYLQGSRARELALTTDLLAADPHDTAYLVEATRGQLDDGGEIDRRSILDLIDERRREMGFDFAIMLDPNGEVLVRTDRPDATGQMLGNHPLVAPVLEDFIPEYGPWREGNRLFNAAVVPLTTAFELVGFLVTGLLIDDEVAADIKRVTGVDVAFLALAEDREALGASTLDLRRGEQLLQALAANDVVLDSLRTGQTIGRLDIELGGETWVARIEPITDPGGQVLGAALAIDSLDARLAGFRTVQAALLAGGLAAVLIALVLSLLVARRIARPVGQLAVAADQAAQGDYEQHIDTRRKDEVGTLAKAFHRLLADLREQQEIAGYVTDLSSQLDEQAGQAQPEPDAFELGAARTGPMWIIALEWPGQAGTPSPTDLQQLEQWLPGLGNIARRNGADLIAGGAARFFLVLDETATDNLPGLLAAVLHQVQGLAEPPAMALAFGDATTARLSLGENRTRVVSGVPVSHAEVLLREAGSGRLLLSPAAFKLAESRLAQAGAETRIVDSRSGKRRFRQLVQIDAEPDRTAPVRLPRTETGPRAITGGRVLGDRFEILEPLGEGAMGSVFKARDRKLGDVVALKLLKPALANDPEYLERMKSEIRLARRITHPNVLRTHDFFEIEDLPVISMEYVHGITLSQLLERSGRLSLAAGLRVSTQVLQGLHAAHSAGVLHRDIKPANIILDPRGNARLMDFGIARQVVEEGKDLTRTGTIEGTANYMAPEVLLGKKPDARADIYAMGVMMNEMFTGQLPFHGQTSMEICMAHVQQQPEPPSKTWPEIPPALERIILQCMAKAPDQRHATAQSLLEDLVRVRREEG
jgi:eukaryotic-like serine/threonine-protein kinase